MPVEKSQMMSLSGEQTKNKEEKQIQETTALPDEMIHADKTEVEVEETIN